MNEVLDGWRKQQLSRNLRFETIDQRIRYVRGFVGPACLRRFLDDLVVLSDGLDLHSLRCSFATQVYRIVDQKPERAAPQVIAAICDIFSCGPRPRRPHHRHRGRRPGYAKPER